jgi:hypothetical protein
MNAFECLARGKPKLALRQLSWQRRLRSPEAPLRLHLGCGQKRLDGYVNIDHNLSPATDFVWDITNLPCSPNTVERIETYHVIEHIPLPMVRPALARWLSILKPGGILVAECPDFRRDCEDFLAGNYERIYSVFGRQRFNGDAHFFGYTEQSLCDLLISTGFSSTAAMPPSDYHSNTEPCIRVEAIK